MASWVILALFSSMMGMNALECHPYRYLRPDKEECCSKCIPGHRIVRYCSELHRTVCDICDDGTYMTKFNGEKHCNKCLICTEENGLREILYCTNRENAECGPVEGFFCVEGPVDKCMAAQRHSRCKPGEYIYRAGTSSRDTDCRTCSEGTFSNGTSTSCESHKRCSRVLRKGTTTSDSVCGEGLTPGEKAGIVAVTVVVMVAAIAGFSIYCCMKRRKKGRI